LPKKLPIIKSAGVIEMSDALHSARMFPPGSMAGTASSIFKILFWVHQVVLGLPSGIIGLDLVIRGQTDGILAAIGLLLAWIGGTLMWGLAALIHKKQIY
jgi:hypothetical protein